MGYFAYTKGYRRGGGNAVKTQSEGNELDELMKLSRGISQAALKLEQDKQRKSRMNEEIQGVHRGLREISFSVALKQLRSIASPSMIKQIEQLTGKEDTKSLRKLIVRLAHDLEASADNSSAYGHCENAISDQVKTLAILIELLFSLE